MDPVALGRWRMAREVVICLLAVAMGLWLVPWREDATADHLAANSHKASLALIRQRRVTDSVTKQVEIVTRQVTNQSAALRRMGRQADSLLAANDALLSDSLTIASPEYTDSLRSALSETTASYRAYRDSTSVLLGSIDSLLAGHLREREAWQAERHLFSRVIAGKDAEIRHLTRAKRGAVLRAFGVGLFVSIPLALLL